jgi:hypothetical protein
MVKGLAALTNITVAATAALLLHGCGKPKEEEAEPTQADADAASGVHPSVEAQMDGRNKGKHTRERPDKDGNSQNIEDEFDGQTAYRIPQLENQIQLEYFNVVIFELLFRSPKVKLDSKFF